MIARKDAYIQRQVNLKYGGDHMRHVQENSVSKLENPERRQKLLAMVHIAKKDLDWSEKQYRLMLSAGFGVPTAAALSNKQLQMVVDYFISKYGWNPMRPKQQAISSQVSALQYRLIDFIPQIPGGKDRVQGLCHKLCGVDRIEWCHNASKLKRLLAAMGNIKRREVKQSA